MSNNLLYNKLPLPLQNMAISLYGFYWKNHRLGGDFYKSYLDALKREFFNTEQWQEYQTSELRKILIYAFENVPFYRVKYTKAGITLNYLKNIKISQLNELPFLTKDEFRKFGKSTLLSSKKGKGIFKYSSGSTGTPIAIYFGKPFHQKWFGICEARVKKWAGVTKDDPRGMIGGRRIIPESVLKPPFYRYNYFEKQTYFSAYHLTSSTASNYLEGMIKNGVQYMTGYAMSNYFLAEFLKCNNLEAPRLKAVLTSSEKLTLEMRQLMEKVYQCKVYDSYSGSEASGLISENGNGELLVSPDVGIMEFISNNGGYAVPGEIGELVQTGFLNYDQPLIRYKIGDQALLSKDQETISGHQMIKVDEIIGRVEDVVVGKDGRKMVRFHSIYLNIIGLRAAQLIQEDYDNYSFNLLIDGKEYNKLEAELTIKKRLASQLGDVKVNFNYPPDLMLTANGKIKAVISKIHK